MNHQDVPPKPGTPPTGGLRQVPLSGQPPAPEPASVHWSQPVVKDAGPGSRGKTQRNLWKALFVVVLLAVIGSLVWLATWLNSSGNSESADPKVPGTLETAITPPASPRPLPREGVTPAEYALGDCFTDFDPQALVSTLVPCDTGHSAQLVAVFRYPDAEPYPGEDALKAKALEACQAARLGPAANQYQLNFQRSYPSSNSWEAGDRRADCYVTAEGGNAINASVLP